MAKKSAARYVCENCGAVSSAWAGRCATCGEWNSLNEEINLTISKSGASGQALKSEDVTSLASKKLERLKTDIQDVDNVLGGGLVPGSVTLLAGQPGIGKSTLLLQLAYAAAGKAATLYVSGEESAQQVSMRAKRLGANRSSLQLASSNSADDVALTILKDNYKLVIVDSVQTLTCNDLNSPAGSVSQISGSTQLIMAAAKQTNTAVILVGHVTKEGMIAGPKVLEHVVDVVLQLEGETSSGFKVLRSSKNRFGSTNEAGIFEMTESGLQTVVNPSAALLAERQVCDGSIVLATLEGNRPVLVEVQALVNKTSYGYPKRAASGMDLNRVNLLVAMLERRTKLNLSDKDIYINIVGGLRLSEPAADLAVCLAIGSAAKGLQLKANAVVFGEVGLSGEVRRVPFVEKRLNEAKKLGFDSAIGPTDRSNSGKKSTMLKSVPDVRTALNQFLEKD
ncbi:MAG: DNA repair protein RadA [Candidatus Saccharimonadales bacterium]